jgi:hypothetical protein
MHQDDRSRQLRRRRHQGHPIRAWREGHPSALRGVGIMAACGGLIYLTVQHFLLAH